MTPIKKTSQCYSKFLVKTISLHPSELRVLRYISTSQQEFLSYIAQISEEKDPKRWQIEQNGKVEA